MDNPQSLNLYTYVLNNPLVRVDADGHIDCSAANAQLVGCKYNADWNAEHGTVDNTDDGGGGPEDSEPQQQLTNAQDSAMNSPNLQPGAHGHPSHCSEATCQIAGAVGADTSPLGPANGGFYQANTQVANLDRAANTPGSGWQRIDLSSAQSYANKGKLVVIGWSNPRKGGSGHTVTVRPDLGNMHGATNPTVAQVGGSTGNGVMPFRNAFGSDKRGAVQVYVYVGH